MYNPQCYIHISSLFVSGCMFQNVWLRACSVLIYQFCFTERYNVDKTQISVSGISSGGAMATQIHVIYSSDIMGAGMIAGGNVDSFNYLHSVVC